MAVEARPRPARWPADQAHLNFVALLPTWLPPGMATVEVLIRPESVTRWSSLLLRASGGGRVWRLKEFLYDWWVPTSTATNLVGELQPLVTSGQVGFTGMDYRQRPAACLASWRTQLELAAEAGPLPRGEAAAFYAGLLPADPAAAADLVRLPFATVSFVARSGQGPWGYDLIAGCRWDADRGVVAAHAPLPLPIPDPLPAPWAWDSGAFRSTRRHAEVQVLLRHAGNWNDIIWIRGTALDSADAVPVPPLSDLADRYRPELVSLGRRDVWMGARSPLGPRLAAWREGGATWDARARASLAMDAAGWRAFIAALPDLTAPPS